MIARESGKISGFYCLTNQSFIQQKVSSPPTSVMTTRNGVFISYSHSDKKKWLALLQKYLDSYVDQNQISYWDDTKIKPGQIWLTEIEAALAATKVAVLLVSQDFLRSKFISTHEMPEIINASRSSGLEIFWIPVDVSSYERTLLNQFQAAHDPKEPLAKLKPFERAEIIVKICDRIYQVLNNSNGASESASPQPSKMKTRYEIIRCNRGQYLNRYLSFFNAARKDRPSLPQACLIFGKLGQSHDTLVERLHREVIKPIVDRESTAALQRGILYKKSDVRWPDLSDIETQEEDLQIELSREYKGEAPTDYPPTFPANVFAGLEQFTNYQFVTVQHTIDLGSGGDWPGHAQTLTWYLQTYWAEVAKTLESAGEKPRWPHFLIFIKVRYEPPGLLQRKFDPEGVKAELTEIAKQTNMSFPCMVLGELQTPTRTEVVRWYTDNDIYDSEQDRFDAALNLYKTYGEQISMAIIERELAKCLT